MRTFEWVLIITAAAGIGGTGIGGAISLLFRRDSSRTVSLLLSFAGGIMIGIVCFDMIPASINPESADRPMNILFVVFGIAVGYLIVWLLNLWIDDAADHELDRIGAHRPGTSDALNELIHSNYYVRREKLFKASETYSGGDLLVAGIVMACAIALHNVPEGMVIGAAYAASPNANVFEGTGILMAAIIGLHNIPEGMAVAVPLISGGASKPNALLIAALSGTPTMLGAILGYCLGTASPLWLSFSLSFASGAMLYVVLGELIPEAVLIWRSKLPSLAVVFGILIGLLLIHL